MAWIADAALDGLLLALAEANARADRAEQERHRDGCPAATGQPGRPGEGQL